LHQCTSLEACYAQGLLSDRYLHGIPEDSRVRRGEAFNERLLSEESLARVRALNEIAERRGQSLAQLAIAWVLRDSRVSSALIGASSVAQLEQSVAALDKQDFRVEELAEIDRYAVESAINLWAPSSNA
jgi:L-glyceraldehyde 3-phosphate reductase